VATVARLLDLGLKPFVIASALEAVISQRLVRKICTECRISIQADSHQLHKLGPAFENQVHNVFKGEGCPKCNGTGYHGRAGLYEVLVPDANMRHLITSAASVIELEKAADTMGATTLIQDGLSKVQQGVTTLEEILRVLGPQVME
jgi:type II secretory ATPase GspE/PulE/Tfp pilus assembly ATPase PilB-like protein